MNAIRLASAVLALAAAALAPGAARAESFHTCAGVIATLPAVIATQGTWCLQQDLATSMASGDAITISVNNVTIDCNGFKLGGLGAGPATTTTGIRAQNRSNATVRHCTIRGFGRGVGLTGTGGGHVVEDNRLEGNTFVGIEVGGDGSVVRRNLVLDTGGSTITPGVTGVVAGEAVDVRDNIIDGLAPDAMWANATMTGLLLASNDRGAIVGNRIGGMASAGTGVALGIDNLGSDFITLADNQIVGDGRPGGIGITCSSAEGVARDNTVQNFATQIFNCTDVNTTP